MSALKIPLLDLSRQHKPLLPKFEAAFHKIMESSGFILGPEVKQLEDAFSAYCGVKHGVSCSNGTDALYMALKALDVGPGTEVITTGYTFMATVGAIERTGARPVLVDIEPETFTIDVTKIEAAITPKTKAIMPVHLYGQAADMDAILSIAKKHNLHVVEDCAQAHGATWKGKRVGGMGVIGCFSFFPSKNLGAMGDAGICVTNDETLAKRMERIRVHGRGNKHESFEKGDNLRIDTLQAAFLAIKLPFLDKWNASRKQVAKWYDAKLKGVARYTTPKVGANREHVYHLYVILAERRDDLIKSFDAAGIGCGVHYPVPVHLMKGFANLGYKKGDFPVSEGFCDSILSIPIFPGMTEAEVDEVVKVMRA
jgi:dTDP-4-amino-4,6-dideoxygalactose transaminase